MLGTCIGDWASIKISSEIARILLDEFMGYTVALQTQPFTTTDAIERLAKGHSHVHLEMWDEAQPTEASYHRWVMDQALVTDAGQSGMGTALRSSQPSC
jgi:hypothetical protein